MLEVMRDMQKRMSHPKRETHKYAVRHHWSPNPPAGFGAAGPLLCLGAHLARREMTVTLRELLTPVPGMVAGEPGRLLSSFINGIKP